MSINKDRIIAKHMPTIMMPAYEPLEKIEINRIRFIMGKDGLYLETRPPWGVLVKQVWKSPRLLPYGSVTEQDTFIDALLSAKDIIRDIIIPEAAAFAREGKEWAGFITWQEKGYEYTKAKITANSAMVEYEMPPLNNRSLAIDIHSHGVLRPFFSLTDDNDDKGGIKVAVVLGNYNRNNGMDIFESVIRYCVEGFHFSPKGKGECVWKE